MNKNKNLIILDIGFHKLEEIQSLLSPFTGKVIQNLLKLLNRNLSQRFFYRTYCVVLKKINIPFVHIFNQIS